MIRLLKTIRSNTALLNNLGNGAKEGHPAMEEAAQGSDLEVRSFAKEAAERVRLAK
jgi:hypothetical protein